jgi:hypothetical protein
MPNVGERFGLLPQAQPEVVELPEGLQVTRTSIFTKRRNTMVLPIKAADYIRYRDGGGLVQDIFPDLNAEQREFLMSGATQAEWDNIFDSSDDEED